MSEIMLTGIGLICIVFTWKLVWLPSVLDTTRDTLFDLRDRRLRRYFVSHGIALDHPVYVALRDLLNGHLRNTRSFSLGQLVYLRLHLEKNKAAAEKRLAEMNLKFQVDDPRLQAFIDQIRIESSAAMLNYMVESSPLGLLLSLACRVTFALRRLPFKAIFATNPAKQASTVVEECAFGA